MSRVALCADFLHFLDEPSASDESGYEYFENGLMVINDGRVEQLGFEDELRDKLTDDVVIDESNKGKLIMPGMIDTHCHYPQVGIIGSYGEQLLDWLNNYTFPAEMGFGDKAYAKQVAELFLTECFSYGTTTAMVFCTKHPESVDAFFETAEDFNARMIAGKVMMDRNAPAELLDTPELGYSESKALIERWHGKGRQSYAITPRFPPTSTPEQLQKAAELKQLYPDVYVHSHISENKAEIEWVNELYPDCNGYLDVFDHYGLLSDKTILAHGVHLTDDELVILGKYGSTIAFCPTSNMFLGSGLLERQRYEKFGVGLSLATDVGAGTDFSMLKTLLAAYEVGQLKGQKLDPLTAFYWVTLGNAKRLKLDDKIGNFTVGKEADFIVLNPNTTKLMAYRYSLCDTLQDKLFSMMCIGDDRLIDKTYLMGRKVYDQQELTEQ